MTVENIILTINDDLIACKNDVSPLDFREWSIELLPDKMIYHFKRKTVEFLIQDISEIQFEADGYGRYGVQQIVKAYIILKQDPKPHTFFSLIVNQKEFALLKDTEASKLCQQILSFIGTKYNLTWTYKISIEVKAKKNRIGLVFAVLIFIPIWIWLLHKYHL